MKILADDLRVLCLSEGSALFKNAEYEICQLVAFDADNLANSLIGATVSSTSPHFAPRLSFPTVLDPCQNSHCYGGAHADIHICYRTKVTLRMQTTRTLSNTLV
jgi:hypothetical protein